MKWITLIIIVLAVIADAVADAERDEGHKLFSHTLEAFSILALLMLSLCSVILIEVVKDFWFYIFGMYIVQRLFFFDIFYNAIRGICITYIGRTSLIDKFLRKIKMHPTWWLWARFVIWIAYTGGVMLNY